MSFGLASRNRHFAYDWMAGAPKPGELEYLGGLSHGQQGPTLTRGLCQICELRHACQLRHAPEYNP